MTFGLLSMIYGLSWADLNSMPIAAITAYMEKVPNMIAMKKLISGEGALVPHAKEWKRILRTWSKAFMPDESRVKATPGMLKLIGIGVKHVHKPG